MKCHDVVAMKNNLLQNVFGTWNPFVPMGEYINTINGTLANSVDPDQKPENASSDQDQHSCH